MEPFNSHIKKYATIVQFLDEQCAQIDTVIEEAKLSIAGYYSKYNYEGEYLLIGRQGALCGNVHKIKECFWATEHAVVTKNVEGAELSFLYYLLNGMNLNRYASNSAAQPGLSVNNCCFRDNV